MSDTSPRQTAAGQIPPDDPTRRLATAALLLNGPE